ncbi:MAG: hypothetical protein ABFC98_06945 [Candidatus Cloacimonas sp.]
MELDNGTAKFKIHSDAKGYISKKHYEISYPLSKIYLAVRNHQNNMLLWDEMKFSSIILIKCLVLVYKLQLNKTI